MKIVITGATGCIGCAIVSRALQRGYDVTCIVHKGSGRVRNLPQGARVKIVECDQSGYSSLALKDHYDVFIHLAWEGTFGPLRDDASLQLRNIQGTLDAVQLAHRLGCSVFVGAGSQAEYGIQNEPLSPGLPVRPESGYGIAKYAAGKLSALLCSSLGIRQNWVRIVSVFGPHDSEGTLISYLIREFSAGRSPELTRCEQIWDYLYADDAAEAFLAVAENGKDGKAYPLGSGTGRRLSEYVEDIRRIINPNVEIRYGAKDYYPHQPMHLVADITALTRDTGWRPQFSFEEGICQIRMPV